MYLESCQTFINVLYVLGTKTIEVILQQMFEGEIDPTDEGPEDDLDSYEFQQPTKLALDSVA